MRIRTFLLGLTTCAFLSSCADRSNDEALLEAIRSGDSQGAITLLGSGANPDSRFPEGVPALYFAVQERRGALVRALVDAGADVDVSPITLPGATPLGVAAQLGDVDIVHLLLDADASVDAAGESGATPLMMAAQYDQADIAKLLLEAGADIDAQRADGQTALAMAVHHRYENMTQVLMSGGADIELANKVGVTPLLHAVTNNDIELTRRLIDAGANLEVQGPDLIRPLHVASGQGHADLVRILLGACADPDARAMDGVTPLHLAVAANDIDAVKELLKVANPILVAPGGTPMELAEKLGHREIAHQIFGNIMTRMNSVTPYKERECNPQS